MTNFGPPGPYTTPPVADSELDPPFATGATAADEGGTWSRAESSGDSGALEGGPPPPSIPTESENTGGISFSTVAEIFEVVALALVMFLAVRFVAQNFVVDGSSMEPSFSQGNLVLVNKLAYRSFDVSWLPWSDNTAWQPFGDPAAGDVVVFRFPRDPGRDFIKRVVAVPGQTVAVHDGSVYVDGVAVPEPYLAEPPLYEFGPEVVPEGSVFVLGDNRNNSYDSHQWGMLDRSEIIGRAELRYWPLSEAGLIDHHRYPQTDTAVSSSPR